MTKKFSVIIPVFNSEQVIGETVDRTVAFFRQNKLDLELILINDGSQDASWKMIATKAEQYEEVTAINLLHNYGQHVANFCGFTESTGDFIITMDDDLQNPPEEIIKLIDKSYEGYDLVIGEFKIKNHTRFRRIGSKIVSLIIRMIFKSPKNLVLSNFRLVHRNVVDRVCQRKIGYPYIPGLLILYSSKRTNVTVEHSPRMIGKSNYNLFRIAKLVTEILFNYSSYPLRFIAVVGLIAAILSFFVSIYFFMKALFAGTSVPGWASVVVMLSFFNGMNLLILGMMGEYLVRLIKQTNYAAIYHIESIVRGQT